MELLTESSSSTVPQSCWWQLRGRGRRKIKARRLLPDSKFFGFKSCLRQLVDNYAQRMATQATQCMLFVNSMPFMHSCVAVCLLLVTFLLAERQIDGATSLLVYNQKMSRVKEAS